MGIKNGLYKERVSSMNNDLKNGGKISKMIQKEMKDKKSVARDSSPDIEIISMFMLMNPTKPKGIKKVIPPV